MRKPVVKKVKRRGRGPSLEKTAETRRAIMKAAVSIFLERGYSDTRVMDVAERAGLAKGTLYLYYSDKEALFEGVLRGSIGEPMTALAASSRNVHETTRAFVGRTILPFLRDMESSQRAAVVRLMISEGGRFPALASMYRQVVLEPAMNWIRQLAAEAVARGELKSEALVRFPLLLLSPGLMAMVWNGMYGAEQPINAADAFEAFLDLTFPKRVRG